MLVTSPAHAGCGCDKPPPPPAAVRPAFGSPGDVITLFSNDIKVGNTYTVQFGNSSKSITALGVVVNRRDLADGVYKPQVVVPLPSLPLGPTSVSVTGATAGGVIISAPDSAFTVAPTPVAIPADYGRVKWAGFQAAVGRDDYAPFEELLTVLSKPYEDQPARSAYADPPEPHQRVLQTFCGT